MIMKMDDEFNILKETDFESRGMKIRISKLDKLFSLYIRNRDGWRCQRCLKQYQAPTTGLHCAHIFTRSRKSVRFDTDNAISLCYGCHSWGHKNPLEFYTWVEKRMGKRAFTALRLRSNKAGKLDHKLIEVTLKEHLKEYE